MNFNNIRNVGYPQHNEDAVPRSFVDEMVKTTLEQVQNQFKQLNQLVSVSASCYARLKKDDYQFTFGGPILNGKINELDKFNGFLVPANGVIKHFTTKSTGLIQNTPPYKGNEILEEGLKTVIELYGREDNPTKIFSLVKISNNNIEENIGSIVFYSTDIKNVEGIYNIEKRFLLSETVFEFRPLQKYLNKEENFICSVNRGDIINIKSEYSENISPNLVKPGEAMESILVHFFPARENHDFFFTYCYINIFV